MPCERGKSGVMIRGWRSGARGGQRRQGQGCQNARLTDGAAACLPAGEAALRRPPSAQTTFSKLLRVRGAAGGGAEGAGGRVGRSRTRAGLSSRSAAKLCGRRSAAKLGRVGRSRTPRPGLLPCRRLPPRSLLFDLDLLCAVAWTRARPSRARVVRRTKTGKEFMRLLPGWFRSCSLTIHQEGGVPHQEAPLRQEAPHRLSAVSTRRRTAACATRPPSLGPMFAC
jgi:hypothetical protein